MGFASVGQELLSIGGFGVIRERLLLIIFVSLLLACSFVASSNEGSKADSISSSSTPLFDYRYNQVAEELGILKNGTSESKLEYGSIETASLTPLYTPQKKGCRLNIKQADLTMGVCQWETEQTCFDSCGSTCSGTCGGTCGNTCGDTCSGTCMMSCRTCILSCGADTCGSTCQDTCGGCGQTLSYTCGETCGNTCRDTCIRTCSDTCANTCGKTCRGTCSRTCSNTCANTCGQTCHNTCFATCQRTCARTCQATCSATCSATCLATCQPTCSATCGPYCAGTQASATVASGSPPMAKSSTKTPLAAEQNSLRSYNIVAMPPASVNYLGAYTPWSIFQQSFSGDEIYAWIETESGWDVIARTPKGTWVREFVFVPVTGNLISNEITPDGNTRSQKFEQVVAGYKYMWIYAENPGSYIGTFKNDAQKSNNVTLEVY
jgi:hypothetical protein